MKLIDHTYAWNSLSNFDYVITGNGSFRTCSKNSWNHYCCTYFQRILAFGNPLCGARLTYAHAMVRIARTLDTVQDFFIKLDIKPCMYPSIGNGHFFTISCHRQTYQNYEQNQQKLGTFLEHKVLQKLKFSKNFIFKSWFKKIPFWFLMMKNDFESTNFAIFEEVVHNYGRSEDDMI